MNQRRLSMVLAAGAGALVLALSWLLVACAGPTPTPPPPPPTQPPAATAAAKPTQVPTQSAPTQPAPTSAPKAVTLSVWTNRIGVQAKLLEDIARKFEQENPGIKIDFSAPGAEYENLMKVKMSAKDMPDVFSTHGWAKVRYGDFLLDLRDQPWAANIDKAIKPAVVDDAGKVYVLPMDQEKTGMIYNADIFKEYAINVPATWDQLLAACETVKTKGAGKVTCIHMGGADSWPIGQYYDYFSAPLAITPKNNDAQALLSGKYDWSKYVVLSKNLLALQQKGYLNKDVLTAKYSDSAKAMAEGKVAIEFYPAVGCEEALKTNPKFNCAIMPIPSFSADDPPTFAGGELTTWGVWKDSKNVDAAKKLVAYYAKPENITAVANSNRVPTGINGVPFDAGYLTQYYTKYADLRSFTYFDRVYLPNGMWDVLCKAGQDVLAGGATPEQATQTIQKEYDRLKAAK